MTYTKPEVAILGKAAVVIESSITVKTPQHVLDAMNKLAPTPAYDLDE
jgi:hypothetical protein